MTTYKFIVRAETLAIDDGGMATLMATDTIDHQNMDRHNLAVAQGAYAQGKKAMLDSLVAASFAQAVEKSAFDAAAAETYLSAIKG